MNILQKAYNLIKQNIDFILFKRKFNAWFEQYKIELEESIIAYDDDIISYISRHNFNEAFNRFWYKQNAVQKLKLLPEFKSTVLNEIKNHETNDN